MGLLPLMVASIKLDKFLMSSSARFEFSLNSKSDLILMIWFEHILILLKVKTLGENFGKPTQLNNTGNTLGEFRWDHLRKEFK